jgi:hypothetical protein
MDDITNTQRLYTILYYPTTTGYDNDSLKHLSVLTKYGYKVSRRRFNVLI